MTERITGFLFSLPGYRFMLTGFSRRPRAGQAPAPTCRKRHAFVVNNHVERGKCSIIFYIHVNKGKLAHTAISGFPEESASVF